MVRLLRRHGASGKGAAGAGGGKGAAGGGKGVAGVVRAVAHISSFGFNSAVRPGAYVKLERLDPGC